MAHGWLANGRTEAGRFRCRTGEPVTRLGQDLLLLSTVITYPYYLDQGGEITLVTFDIGIHLLLQHFTLAAVTLSPGFYQTGYGTTLPEELPVISPEIKSFFLFYRSILGSPWQLEQGTVGTAWLPI